MKKNLIILTSLFFITSCSDKDSEKVTINTYSDKKTFLEVKTPLTLARHEIHEFEYKGHVYLYTEVHGGITITHAGHCPCNK